MTAARSAPGDERAGVARERCGQHRLDRAGHVHARRAPARLAVQRRALGHVRGDVGDVHPHARPASAPASGSAEIASSKSRALTGSIVNVARSRRSRRSPGARATRFAGRARLALERRRRSRARGRGRASAPRSRRGRRPGDRARARRARRTTAARGAVHEHELAVGDLDCTCASAARGSERQARWPRRDGRLTLAVALTRREQRLRGQEATATLDHRDERAAGQVRRTGAASAGGRRARSSCARATGALTSPWRRACSARRPGRGRVSTPFLGTALRA